MNTVTARRRRVIRIARQLHETGRVGSSRLRFNPHRQFVSLDPAPGGCYILGTLALAALDSYRFGQMQEASTSIRTLLRCGVVEMERAAAAWLELTEGELSRLRGGVSLDGFDAVLLGGAGDGDGDGDGDIISRHPAERPDASS